MFFGCLPCCGEVQGSCPDPLSLSGFRVSGQAEVSFGSHSVTYLDDAGTAYSSGTMPASSASLSFAHTFSVGATSFTAIGPQFLYPVLPGISDQQGVNAYRLALNLNSFNGNAVSGFTLFGLIDSQFAFNISHERALSSSLLHRPCGGGSQPFGVEYVQVLQAELGTTTGVFSNRTFNGQAFFGSESIGLVTRDSELPPLATVESSPVIVVGSGVIPEQTLSAYVLGPMNFSLTMQYDELYWILGDGSELPAFRWGFAGIEWQQ